MSNTPDLHCPPLIDPTRLPAMAGSISALDATTLASGGHMILENVRDWLGSTEDMQIVGRWVPDGSNLGELGATMAVAFAHPLAPDEKEDEKDDESSISFSSDCIADEFFLLECVQRNASQDTLVAMLPWSVWDQYRHPIVGLGEVQTLRSNIGGPWAVGGELHVTFDADGRPFCAELTTAFWQKAEVADGLRWLSDLLNRHASRAETVFETVTDGDEVRFGECWWTNDTAHYEVFCTLGEECAGDANPDAAPHYITVRKFLIPSSDASAE